MPAERLPTKALSAGMRRLITEMVHGAMSIEDACKKTGFRLRARQGLATE